MSAPAAFLTGASSGIGWETAQVLSRAGYRLAIAARREEKLADLAKELPGETLQLPLDVTDREAVFAAVERTVETFGTLDLLVNNAGILDLNPFESQDLDTIEAIMRTNYFGPVYALKAALPHLRKTRGHVVNVASIAGIQAMPNMAAYAASKFALVGLTESLRRELYDSGVTLTALCPGIVETPMAEEALKRMNGGPLRQPLTSRQVAEKVLAAARDRTPEIIYGEAPGAVLKLAKFTPKFADWAIHKGFKRYFSRS
jgi:short-subunit dehydrogenase